MPLVPTPVGSMPPATLDSLHFRALNKAVSRLLATNIARQTLAQLMDGLPTLDVIKWCLSANNLKGSPLMLHKTLYPGAQDNAN